MTMNANNPLKDALLEQAQHNGTSAGNVNHSIQNILARDQARVKRMKWLTLFAWLALPIDIIIVIAMKSLSDSHLAEPVGIIAFQGLLLIAICFSISLYIRHRTLTMNQIQSRLSDIENLLKQVLQDKQGS
jgi:hypothetical protein